MRSFKMIAEYKRTAKHVFDILTLRCLKNTSMQRSRLAYADLVEGSPFLHRNVKTKTNFLMKFIYFIYSNKLKFICIYDSFNMTKP